MNLNDIRALSIGLLLLALLAGCSSDPQDRKRVLSKAGQDGAPGDAVDSGPIDLQKISTDVAERDRLMLMTHAELSQRLGSHRFRTRSKVRVAIGDKVNTLEEKGEITVSPKGSFSVSSSNQKGRVRDVVFVNGLLAHRAANGPWTLERGDGFEQRFREGTYRMWAVTYKMFRGHLSFGSPQPAEYDGRDAVRYSISLSDPEGNAQLEDEASPPPLTATDDERENARLERLVKSRRGNVKRYLAANGHLIVDEKTQVPLKFVFDGQYEVQPRSTKRSPGKKTGGAGEETENLALALRVSTYHIETEVLESGKPHVVNLPEESKPPPRRRKINAKPLEGLVDQPEAKPGPKGKSGAAKP